MLHLLFALFVYILALLGTFALIVVLPVVLVSQILEHRRNGRSRVPMMITLLIGVGYFMGGVVGWLFRPAQWSMSFGQTFEAAFNAAKYGHTLESQAERVLMYPWYMAVLCSIAVAVVAGIILQLRGRAAGMRARVRV